MGIETGSIDEAENRRVIEINPGSEDLERYSFQ